jgi:short-subunit dehydrogenase
MLFVKPGNVITPMTLSNKRKFLTSSPKSVAFDIFKAIKKNKNTIYSPWYWFFIMLCIKLIPNKVFNFLKLGKIN